MIIVSNNRVFSKRFQDESTTIAPCLCLPDWVMFRLAECTWAFLWGRGNLFEISFDVYEEMMG
jgi:hypothetical protein